MPSLAAIAVALASPVILGDPGGGTATLADPATLQPIRNAPTFSSDYDDAAVAPGGGRLAVRDGGTLTLSGVRGRRPARRIRVGGGNGFVFWPRARRIITVTYTGEDRVVAIDPQTRRRLRTTAVRGRVLEATMVRDRLVALVGRSGTKTLEVFDADGRHERRLPLPGLRRVSLHPAGPANEALVVGGHRRAWAAVGYDVVTGAAHWASLPNHDSGWVVPTIPGMLATAGFADGEDVVDILDPASLQVVRTVPVDGLPIGAGTGFTTLPALERGVSLYDAHGDLLWRHPRVDEVLSVGSAGDRVYAGLGYGAAAIRIYDLATGERVGRIKGRYFAHQLRRGLHWGGSVSNDARAEE